MGAEATRLLIPSIHLSVNYGAYRPPPNVTEALNVVGIFGELWAIALNTQHSTAQHFFSLPQAPKTTQNLSLSRSSLVVNINKFFFISFRVFERIFRYFFFCISHFIYLCRLLGMKEMTMNKKNSRWWWLSVDNRLGIFWKAKKDFFKFTF